MSSTAIPRPLPPDISREPDTLIIKWLTVSVAFLLVSLRFYVRGVLRKKLGWDDYTILLAVVRYLPSGLFQQPVTDSSLLRGIRHRREHLLHFPGSQRVRSKHLLPHSTPDTQLQTIHYHMRHAPHCRHRIGQNISVSVRPPSRACHKKILPQVYLGTLGILHYPLNCELPRPMFSVCTSFRTVGQKR